MSVDYSYQSGGHRQNSLLHRIYDKLPKAPSTNLKTGGLQADPVAGLKPGSIVMDIGAKDPEHSVRVPAGVRHIGLDLVPSPGLDVAADAHYLPFPDASADALFFIGVLPHCERPVQVIQEFARVVKPGGRIYIAATWVGRMAADPWDYWRFSASGLQVLCRDYFKTVESGYNRGPGSSMADLLQYFGATVFCFGNHTLYSILLDFTKWFTFWLKYLDLILVKFPQAKILSNCAFFYGERR